MPLMKSWVKSANAKGCDFPLNNLPYGVFSDKEDTPRCGVAIGDQILDLTEAEDIGLVDLADTPVFAEPFWNDLMEMGPAVWTALRNRLTALLADGAPDRSKIEPLLVPMADAELHLPCVVGEYSDFYSNKHHAQNVSQIFRGPHSTLPPNWTHMPIGYNGRASSVCVSGTDVRRPWGQARSADQDAPVFRPSRQFDFELELGALVGVPSDGPLTAAEADAHIFGFVLLNDWSARDIQAWESQPLGPFQSKATATSISPWIVTRAALAPFRTAGPARDVPLSAYLQETEPAMYDIAVQAHLAPAGQTATVISDTNYKHMYFSAAQQLAHHTTSGCPMNAGDLLGSGTISGPTRQTRGCLLEVSWGGQDPVALDTGADRLFLEDGDEVTLTGYATGDGYRIGFGACRGRVLPALPDPFAE